MMFPNYFGSAALRGIRYNGILVSVRTSFGLRWRGSALIKGSRSKCQPTHSLWPSAYQPFIDTLYVKRHYFTPNKIYYVHVVDYFLEKIVGEITCNMLEDKILADADDLLICILGGKKASNI